MSQRRYYAMLIMCFTFIAYGCQRRSAPTMAHQVSGELAAVAYKTPVAPAAPPSDAEHSGDVRYVILQRGVRGFYARPGPDVMCAVEYVFRDVQGRIVREVKAPPLMDYDGFRPELRTAFLGMTAGEIRRVWIYKEGKLNEIFDIKMASVWKTGNAVDGKVAAH